MATRSMIGLQLPGGAIRAIYCHWDGYPKHHAPILLAHYTTPAQVEALIALGSLSELGTEIGEKQDFSAPRDGWCLAYGRDRGEADTEARRFPTDARYVNYAWRKAGAEYCYLFRDGAWLIWNEYEKGWVPLASIELEAD